MANQDSKVRYINTDGTAEYATLAALLFKIGEYDNGNSGATLTIDLDNSISHLIILTDNCTFTISNGKAGVSYVFRLVQDATGSRTVTWPASVKWPGGSAPTLSTAAASIDIITLYFDGTDFYGVESINFS